MTATDDVPDPSKRWAAPMEAGRSDAARDPSRLGGALRRGAPAPARPLVIKFGGTSLGTARRVPRAAARVRAHVERGRQVVVVVSATGGTTDRIIRRLTSVDPLRRPEPREVDRALATGEELAAALFAAALAGEGVIARSVRGGEAGIVAEGGFCGARIARVDAAPLLDLLRQEVVPVVAGFQAVREDGETVTLGRGGSDTTAVALAASLRAECHIVTDVDAVYDRDPHVHPGAFPFRTLSHEALVGLARAGARVIHAPAAEHAQAAGIPLRIYHHRASLDGAGTRVVSPAIRGRRRGIELFPDGAHAVVRPRGEREVAA
jgi:aspartate kinase